VAAVVKLHEIATARSSDRGNHATIAVVANNTQCYDFLAQTLTAAKVESFFAGLGVTSAQRFELPGVQALNFVLYNALGQDGRPVLRLDSQGKLLGAAMEEMVLRKSAG